MAHFSVVEVGLSGGFVEASISKNPKEVEILQLCDESLASMGFRVVDVDCRLGGRSLIRIFIERADATPPSLENCSEFSRAISQKLDEKDLIPGAYDLEVSSPGLDRRLRLESDFKRVVGSDVKLKLFERIPGRGSNVTGKVTKVETGNLWIEIEKEEVAVALPKVKQANLVWRA